MDIICPVRPGDRNEELRYAIRSWQTNLIHNTIWIVGHKPPWLTGVEHIPGNQRDNSHANVYWNILTACEHPGPSADVLILNDDMFITEPVANVDVLYRSTLAEHLALPRVHRARNGWWANSLRTTQLALHAHGIADPISYELHTPLPAGKQAMAHTLRMMQHVTPDNPPQWRSLYGNLHAIGGHQYDDCKMYGPGELKRPYHSTEDSSFGHYSHQLAALFPQPSRYEDTPCLSKP